jgi:hypothetical protein
MAPSKEVITSLRADVKTESGRKTLYRGDELPADVLPGQAERLRSLGALAAPASPAPEGEDVDEVDVLAASLTEAEMTDYVGHHTIKEIVTAVGENAELAQKVLTAEADATGGEPRPTLVKALEKVIGEVVDSPPATTEGDGQPAADTETPAEAVDYSDWKAPQLKAALDERGIDYPKGVVKNATLVELLEANPAELAA